MAGINVPRIRFPRRFVGMGLASALVLGACGGAQSPESLDSTPVASDQAGESPGPTSGGVLRIGWLEELRNPDNVQAQEFGSRMLMGSTVYESLFQSNDRGEPAPALAAEAIPSEDALVWTVKLQPGVKFHNGKDFTAADVKANFETMLDPDEATPLAGVLSNIASMEVIDDLTIEITLSSPDTAFPATVTDTALIGDMDARDEMGADAWVQSPVGTGPYQWSSRTPGDNVTFERFDDYWRGTPPLDEVIFITMADPQVATLALQQGDIDLLPINVAIPSLPDLRQDPDLQVIGVESSTWNVAYANNERGRRGAYGDDPRVFRLGLAHLINAADQIPAIVGEAGSYANQPLPPWQSGHDPDLEAYPYDPDAGKELLEQAGYSPETPIKLLARDQGFLCDWATAVAANLTENGFTAELRCLEASVAQAESANYDGWDLWFNATSGRATAGAFYNERFHSALAEPRNDQYTYESEEMDALIAQMQSALDPLEAEEAAKQASRLVIEEDIAAYGGYWGLSWWAASTRVNGLKPSPLIWQGFLMNDMTTVSLQP